MEVSIRQITVVSQIAYNQLPNYYFAVVVSRKKIAAICPLDRNLQLPLIADL
jgi:hypothetical protein